MDHEWGSGAIGKGTTGWDWFSVQLEDGRDLMLYLLRGPDGARTLHSSGTLVDREGRSTPLAPTDFTVEVTDRWTSPRSKGVYPARWILRVPKANLALEVVPLLADQELVTDRSTRVTYWEGACAVRPLPGLRQPRRERLRRADRLRRQGSPRPLLTGGAATREREHERHERHEGTRRLWASVLSSRGREGCPTAAAARARPATAPLRGPPGRARTPRFARCTRALA